MLLNAGIRLKDSSKGWELCRKAGPCRDYALRRLYHCRRDTGVALGVVDFLNSLPKENAPEYRALSSQLAQSVARLAATDYHNALKALSAFEREPARFTGKPRLPRLGTVYAVVPITNQQFTVRGGLIEFAPRVGLPAIRVPSIIPSTAKIMSMMLRPEARSLHLDIAYETEPAPLPQRRERERRWQEENNARRSMDSRGQRMILDLNVNGVAMIDDTPRGNLASIVYNLRPLKSRIAFGNIKLAELQRSSHQHAKRAMGYHRGKLNRHTTHFLHCVTNDIVDRALVSDAQYILVGLSNGWKHRPKLGRVGNRRFVSMPLGRVVELLAYKCRRAGLCLQTVEESYTSKVDHLALEPMHRPPSGRFLGRRTKRGLFRSSTGRTIHADVNGCIGIGRKISGDSWIEQSVLPLVRKGARLAPQGTIVASGLATMPRRLGD